MNEGSTSIAQASPNIALIKYWGNLNHELRIPANNSLSITLGDLTTTTTVDLDPQLSEDHLTINAQAASDAARQRASDLLAILREMAGSRTFATIESQNNFPMGAGIASSASAFAALAVAGCAAYGLDLDLPSLSRIARRASGSAARSICSGFVELHCSHEEDGAFAETLFPQDHWDLVDIIAIVDKEHKQVTSTQGHLLADTSPLQAARVADASRRVEICKQALQSKDFQQLAQVVELDSNLMHAVMMTSSPVLLYWQPETIVLMEAVQKMRAGGLEVCYTIDAGPNVHCICSASSLTAVRDQLVSLGNIQEILISTPGPGAALV
jgi:diphosphomevalonate decarboxylase